MNEYRGRASRLAGRSFWCAGLVLMCLAVFSGKGRAADSINLTLNYTVVQGTCTVSVGSDGVNGTLDFGNISYNWKSNDSWPQISLTPFHVRLSLCSGSAQQGTQPGLTITGETDTATNNTVNHNFMFVNNVTSTAKGFGFVIFNKQGTPTTHDAVADINSSEAQGRKYINIPGFGAGTAVTSDLDIILSAAVTCGSTCSSGSSINPNMRAGTLTGAVTFNFLYH